MTNNMIPPKKGAPVPLICLKCHNHFIGPNPSGLSFLDDILEKSKKSKCPKCGSYRVTRNPWINY